MKFLITRINSNSRIERTKNSSMEVSSNIFGYWQFIYFLKFYENQNLFFVFRLNKEVQDLTSITQLLETIIIIQEIPHHLY